MLEKEDNRFVIDLVSKASHRHYICGTLPTIHELHLDKILFRNISSGRSRYMAYSKSRAAERTKIGSDTDRRDFFYYLLNAKDPETGQSFSPSELWGESNLLLACIDEALRLAPPVGGLLPRQVLPGGITVDGQHIPDGTVIGTPHYAIHHHSDYFPQPFEYRPERWISDPGDSDNGSTQNQVDIAHSAFCPFSIGPRGCIGKGMAYEELLTTIARVVFLFDMRLAPGKQIGGGSPERELGRQRTGEFQLKDIFTSARDGPLVQFRAREK
ncbi:MAG: hypothetical protein LQ342_002239 [Letrouitia transgressa]|nr:MAG: hypothetical protein LQ342_002239 [Letrouitia transgressa]